MKITKRQLVKLIGTVNLKESKLNEHSIPTNEMEKFNNFINTINRSIDIYRYEDEPAILDKAITSSKNLTVLLTKIKKDCIKIKNKRK